MINFEKRRQYAIKQREKDFLNKLSRYKGIVSAIEYLESKKAKISTDYLIKITEFKK